MDTEKKDMKINVLIFPAGEINSVELHDALSHQVNIRVFGASSIERHGSYVYENYCGTLPLINQDCFIDEFNNLIDKWKIDFIFPTHDTIALFLTENQSQIHANVIASSCESAKICRDKKATYQLFADCSFCPTQYSTLEKLPVFIKPRKSQGAQDTHLILRKEDIPKDFNSYEYVITEFLPGKELTVDCLTDDGGELIACLPRERIRLLAGICVAGATLKASNDIIEIAETLNERLKFKGLWYFQLKADIKGMYKLLEVSTRCAGTMCLSRARGVNLPLLSVYIAMGKKVNVFENPYTVQMDRTLISRYKINYSYDTVYIDYDDTVVEGNLVCIPVICFLYQCRNKGKRIVLISRHEENYDDSIEDSLRSHQLSDSLFDEIIKLRSDEKKSDYINKERAIFIDNAYMERKEVHDLLGIPVFDIEGIEVLMDDRC